MTNSTTVTAAPTRRKRTALERYTALCAVDYNRAAEGRPLITGEAWYEVTCQLVALAGDLLARAEKPWLDRLNRRMDADYALSTADRAQDAAVRAGLDDEGNTGRRIARLKSDAMRLRAGCR